MPNLLNTPLLLNWENWLRILVMVAIGGAFVHFGSKLINKKGN